MTAPEPDRPAPNRPAPNRPELDRPAPTTPLELLGAGRRAAYRDRTRPFVTYYAGPGSRVELSVASLANAVAKASGMLRDGLGLEPGRSTVSVDLPLHWQLPVWTLAALSVGARCGRRIPGHVDVRVVGPDGLAALQAGARPLADDVLVSSCDTFGMPFPGGLPTTLQDRLGPALHDVSMEARGYPDVFAPEPAAVGAVLLDGPQTDGARTDRERTDGEQADGERSWDHVAARAARGLPAGTRLWVDDGCPDADLLVVAAILPLWVGGSAVLASGVSAQEAPRLRSVEQVTA